MRTRVLAALVAVVAAGSFIASGGASATPFDPGTGTTACGSDTVTWSPAKLWPPNHQLVPVTINTSGTALAVTGVTNDEEGLEKGSTAKTTPDFVISDAAAGGANGSAVVQLRAERNAKPKDGRTYTIAVSCTSGETVSTANLTVFVPHSRKHA